MSDDDPKEGPLLTISEAADFLNVSKATIRRWTNAGLLPCVRLGPRGERRFRPEDLTDRISAATDRSQPRLSAVNYPKKEHAHHRCVICDDPQQEWFVLGAEIVTALRDGAHVFVVDDRDRRKFLKHHLQANGFDFGDLQARAALRCVSIEDSYLLSGKMHWERAVAYFESVILAAKARGVDKVLIVGNSSWLREHSEDTALLTELGKYERGMDVVVERYPGASILCPYTATQVDSQILMEALASHESIGVRPAGHST